MTAHWTAPKSVIAEAAPRFLGCLWNWGLYGALSVQVYWYYIAFPDDKCLQKALVYSVYALDTAQTILVTNDVFGAYARHFGDTDQVNAIKLEWLAVPVFTSIVSCAVQMYYGYRVHILSRSKIPMFIIFAIATMQATAGIAAGVQSTPNTFSSKQLEPGGIVALPIWVAGSAVCDVLIAICMVYLLVRSSTEIAETRTLVRKVVRIVVEAGTLTASTALLVFILYFAIPRQAYFTAVATVLGKLYSVSLLAVFNSRSKFARNHHWTTEPLYLTFRAGSVSRAGVGVNVVVDVEGNEGVVTPLDGIRVQKDVEVRRDDVASEQADMGESEDVKKGQTLV